MVGKIGLKVMYQEFLKGYRIFFSLAKTSAGQLAEKEVLLSQKMGAKVGKNSRVLQMLGLSRYILLMKIRVGLRVIV